MTPLRSIGLVALGLVFAVSAFAHDLEAESVEIADLMGLQPGMTVADVGAGDGAFGEALARRVGDSGHVYLTEISQRELNKIRERLDRTELSNMSVLEGESDDAKIPEACCDAVLLRYVVHHMSSPDEMFSSLRRSLRPGGVIVVVEKDEPGDGITAEELIDGMRKAGFVVLSQHPDWGGHDGNYAVVFRVADGDS
jgi:ubiquinone/menaquinone biosynthesis C-methylase UbiE